MSQDQDNVDYMEVSQKVLVEELRKLYEKARSGEAEFMFGVVMLNNGDVLFYNTGAFSSSADMLRMLGCIDMHKQGFMLTIEDALLEEEEMQEEANKE